MNKKEKLITWVSHTWYFQVKYDDTIFIQEWEISNFANGILCAICVQHSAESLTIFKKKTNYKFSRQLTFHAINTRENHSEFGSISHLSSCTSYYFPCLIYHSPLTPLTSVHIDKNISCVSEEDTVRFRYFTGKVVNCSCKINDFIQNICIVLVVMSRNTPAFSALLRMLQNKPFLFYRIPVKMTSLKNAGITSPVLQWRHYYQKCGKEVKSEFKYHFVIDEFKNNTHLNFGWVLRRTNTVEVIWRLIWRLSSFYWWRKTSGAPLYIISGTSGHLSRTTT